MKIIIDGSTKEIVDFITQVEDWKDVERLADEIQRRIEEIQSTKDQAYQ